MTKTSKEDDVLEEILRPFYNNTDTTADCVAKLQDHILKIVEEVIGEDEPTKIPNAEPQEQQEYHDPVIRNKLRAEQRERLKELNGKL